MKHRSPTYFNRKTYWYFLIAMSAYWGCVDPFEPEVGAYEETLVVDGLFSNSTDPSTVTLSRSFSYNEETGAPIEKATVVIEDDQGERIQLEETAPGVYQTDPAKNIGQIGRSYRLLVTTLAGNQFESEWELMKAAPPIEDLFFGFEERIPDDPDDNPIRGAQIYLNARDTENNTRYYRWEYEETYEYILLYPPRIRVEFGPVPGGGEDQIFNIPPDEFEGLRCWKTENSTRIVIGTTENLTQDVIERFPLHFVDNSTSRLYLRYSILVKQYALNEAYYDHLRKVVDFNQTTGSLFDPIPSEIFGNIRSVDDKDIPVLGYFGVGGVSEKRIFITRQEIPLGFGAPFGPMCQNDTVDLDFRDLYSKVRPGSNLVLYDYDRTLIGGIILGYLVTEPPCASCAASDASNQRPEFW